MVQGKTGGSKTEKRSKNYQCQGRGYSGDMVNLSRRHTCATRSNRTILFPPPPVGEKLTLIQSTTGWSSTTDHHTALLSHLSMPSHKGAGREGTNQIASFCPPSRTLRSSGLVPSRYKPCTTRCAPALTWRRVPSKSLLQNKWLCVPKESQPCNSSISSRLSA